MNRLATLGIPTCTGSRSYRCCCRLREASHHDYDAKVSLLVLVLALLSRDYYSTSN